MKRTFIALAVLFTSCHASRIDLKTIGKKETTNGYACGHPRYVATVAKANTSVNTEINLSLYNLVKEAQAAHGADVTIQNIRYDILGGKKVSVVYDVVKCDTISVGRPQEMKER